MTVIVKLLVLLVFFLLPINSFACTSSFKDRLVEAGTNLYTYQLDNGLCVNLVEDHNVQGAWVYLDVNSGSLSEPDHMPGLAHLVEHMVMSSDGGVDGKSLLGSVGGILYSVKGITDLHSTSFQANVQPDNLDNFLIAMVDRLADRDVPVNLLKREVASVEDEFRNKWYGNDYWQTKLFETLIEQKELGIFQRFGRKEKFESISYETLQKTAARFLRDHYTSNNMSVTIVSGEGIDTLKKRANPILLKLPRGIAKKHQYGEVIPTFGTENTVVDVPYGSAGNAIHLIYPVPGEISFESRQAMVKLLNTKAPDGLLAALVDRGEVSSMKVSADTCYFQRGAGCLFLSFRVNQISRNRALGLASVIKAYVGELIDSKSELNKKIKRRKIYLSLSRVNEAYLSQESKRLLGYEPGVILGLESVFKANPHVFEQEGEFLRPIQYSNKELRCSKLCEQFSLWGAQYRNNGRGAKALVREKDVTYLFGSGGDDSFIQLKLYFELDVASFPEEYSFRIKNIFSELLSGFNFEQGNREFNVDVELNHDHVSISFNSDDAHVAEAFLFYLAKSLRQRISDAIGSSDYGAFRAPSSSDLKPDSELLMSKFFYLNDKAMEKDFELLKFKEFLESLFNPSSIEVYAFNAGSKSFFDYSLSVLRGMSNLPIRVRDIVAVSGEITEAAKLKVLPRKGACYDSNVLPGQDITALFLDMSILGKTSEIEAVLMSRVIKNKIKEFYKNHEDQLSLEYSLHVGPREILSHWGVLVGVSSSKLNHGRLRQDLESILKGIAKPEEKVLVEGLMEEFISRSQHDKSEEYYDFQKEIKKHSKSSAEIGSSPFFNYFDMANIYPDFKKALNDKRIFWFSNSRGFCGS